MEKKMDKKQIDVVAQGAEEFADMEPGKYSFLCRKNGLEKPKKHLETARHCIIKGRNLYYVINPQGPFSAWAQDVPRILCNPVRLIGAEVIDIEGPQSFYLSLPAAQYIALEANTVESYRIAKYLLWHEIKAIKQEIEDMEYGQIVVSDWTRYQWRGCIEQNRRIAGQHEVFGEFAYSNDFKKNVFDQIFHKNICPIVKAKKWCEIKEKMFLNFPTHTRSFYWAKKLQ